MPSHETKGALLPMKRFIKSFVNFFIGDADIKTPEFPVENAEASADIPQTTETLVEKTENTDTFPYYIDQQTTNKLYSLNTVYAAIKLLDHNVSAYQLDERFKTAPQIMKLFKSRGIFEILYGAEVLYLKTNRELSEILKAQGLPYSGTKEALVRRIAEKADLSELDLTPRYRLTNYGKEFKESVFNRLHDAYCNLFRNCFSLIYNGEIAQAYTTIAQYECTKFYKRGLTLDGQGLDWVKIAKEGMPPSERDFYSKYMELKKQRGEQIDACICILANLLGKRASVVEKEYTDLIDPVYTRKYATDSVHSDMIYHALRIEENLQSYKHCRIKQYQIIGTLDKKTCSKCAHMESKIFNVTDAQIGVNCPPFHSGCRCCIGTVFTAEERARMQRAARDWNNKSILVPATTDYKAWAKEYAPQKYKAYFDDKIENKLH